MLLHLIMDSMSFLMTEYKPQRDEKLREIIFVARRSTMSFGLYVMI